MERHFVIHTDQTQYRVRPNPEGPAGDGTDGIVLEWRDAGDDKWNGYFHVAPEAVCDIATAVAFFAEAIQRRGT